MPSARPMLPPEVFVRGITLAIPIRNADVCENYALRNAREAYSLEDAFTVMKAVTQ